jgi:glycosyltransferase involved in cell wall biosynthesis
MINLASSHEHRFQCGVDIALLFAATGGGVQKAHVLIANELVRRGYHAEILVPEAKGPHLKGLDPSVGLSEVGARNPISVILGVVRYLRRSRPKVVLVAQAQMAIATVAAWWLTGNVSRLLVASHNNNAEVARNDSRWMVRIMPLFIRFIIPMADEIITVSHGNAEKLAKLLRVTQGKIRVIYNPVVTPDLPNKAAETPSHPWLEARTCPVVLSVGNLVPQKDLPTLLRAFARVRLRRTARLIIVGEGRERGALEDLARALGIAGDIDFTGFVANPYALMSRASVFALSSAWEGFGTVLAEALACGCPVVSTDCPSGPAEILANGAYGRLVPVGDDAALADAILATLAEMPDSARLRARGATFSVERAVDQYLSLMPPDMAPRRSPTPLPC